MTYENNNIWCVENKKMGLCYFYTSNNKISFDNIATQQNYVQV